MASRSTAKPSAKQIAAAATKSTPAKTATKTSKSISKKTVKAASVASKRAAALPPVPSGELVVLTGLSGAGKLSALKSFEDLGYYAVDNLPLELIPQFADLVRGSREITRAVLGVDVREGQIEKFPAILQQVRKVLPTSVVYLEASNDVLVRRYSETRRPHPLGRDELVSESIAAERTRMETIRNVADVLLDTSKFNVHELRAHINAQFSRDEGEQPLLLSTMSFGFKNGVPPEADLVFDVRFLPNPHFIPEFRPLTGRDAKVAKYVMDFPQTKEFLERTADMLKFLLPYYVKEGKSYLTIALGCTGGQHRSVALAEEIKKRLGDAGYRTKVTHRDMPR
jgi:UPF0042 nucleotide-binding protein